ncbi:RNA polymerase sigma factor [Dyadobacter sp. Leaf189]|uniref:RNA polymerase sigma factor n=1 Tax=Dyadobacter sp. Leaf189 TaxID=1736295 RepID=UPI000701C45C|nr:RNA polymerase sigma factor [Dyadobacter sp. Leaf189]KQS27955.1 RNA polymerase subunit sigma-24 [Dyadobacter sp. Leaf189]
MKFFKSRKYSSLEELVKACQRQDASAQTAFYELYKSKLLGVCARYAKTGAEAEDIFQEALIKVFKNLNDLKDINMVGSWVKSIVIRTAINYYHRTTKMEQMHSAVDEMHHEIKSEDYTRIIQQLDMVVLLEVINSLPDGYRIVVNLFLIDGFTHKEISEMLKITESTSRSQFFKGRNLLIKKLEKKGITHYEIS